MLSLTAQRMSSPIPFTSISSPNIGKDKIRWAFSHSFSLIHGLYSVIILFCVSCEEYIHVVPRGRELINSAKASRPATFQLLCEQENAQGVGILAASNLCTPKPSVGCHFHFSISPAWHKILDAKRLAAGPWLNDQGPMLAKL